LKGLGFFSEQHFQAGVRPVALVGDQIQGIQKTKEAVEFATLEWVIVEIRKLTIIPIWI
jgi:hypothetical protein